MTQKTQAIIINFCWAIIFVIGYLSIWELDRRQPPMPTPRDIVTPCTEKGGIYIRTLDGYVCVKLERL